MPDRTSGHLIEQRVSRREAPLLVDWAREKGSKLVTKADALEFVGSKRLLTGMITRKLFVEVDGGIRMTERGDNFATMLIMHSTRIERTRSKLYDVVVEYDELRKGKDVRFSSRTGFGKLLLEMHEAIGDARIIPATGVADICRHMRNDGAAVLNRANRAFSD